MRRIFSLMPGSLRCADGLEMLDVSDFAFVCLLSLPVELPGLVGVEAGPLDRVLRAV